MARVTFCIVHVVYETSFMKKIVVLILTIVSLHQAIAQEAKIKEELKTYVKERVDLGLNPGISMAYLNSEKVSFFNYGKTKLIEGQEVTESTVYEIGSITKVFTCIILADEVLKGRMKLDDPISKYLPESVSVPTFNGKEITLRHLATHTSALPRMPDNFNPADIKNPFADYTVELLYEFLNNYKLTRDIGSQYEYSNLGMGLLGHILELHTGETYEELIKQRITVPLEMHNTGVTLTTTMIKHLAIGHDDEVKETKNWDITTLAGAGAIRSTTSDMVKFLKANMKNDGSDLYEAMKLSHEVAFSDSISNFKIGLGWHYSSDDTIVWHNGGTGGYKAFAGFLKGTQKGVVVLTNSSYSVDGIGLNQLGQNLNLTMPKKVDFPDIIKVSDDILKSYEGDYQLAPDFIITITKRDNMMIAQATGQAEFEIFASSENEFFLKVVEAKIIFNKDDDGTISGLTLTQNGQEMPAKKIK